MIPGDERATAPPSPVQDTDIHLCEAQCAVLRSPHLQCEASVARLSEGSKVSEEKSSCKRQTEPVERQRGSSKPTILPGSKNPTAGKPNHIPTTNGNDNIELVPSGEKNKPTDSPRCEMVVITSSSQVSSTVNRLLIHYTR